MKITCAKNAGACYGVIRALSMAKDAIDANEDISTYGPIIHNSVVVEEFEKQGMHAVDDIHDINTSVVLIRSHGISPDKMQYIKNMGCKIIDATCPYVMRAQMAAASLAKEYKHVLVVGMKGHPEVEALISYVESEGAKGYVVDKGSCDVLNSINEDVGVVVQTTQTQDTLNFVMHEIKRRNLNAKLINTICSATLKRQNSAQKLASKVDVMLVVGGFNSSNTTHLAQICARECDRTYHIETCSDIDPDWFCVDDCVGITGGASTPKQQIDGIVSYLKELKS